MLPSNRKKAYFLSNVGLQRRIIIFVIVGLVVIYGIFAFIISQTFQESTELVFSERLVMAQNIADIIDNNITYSIGEIEKMSTLSSFALQQSLSGTPQGSPGNTGSCLSMCHDRATVKVSRVSMADEKGKLLSIEPHTSDLMKGDISLEPIIQKALSKGATVIEPTSSTTNATSILAIATPLRNESHAIVGSLNLEFNPFFDISSFGSIASSIGINYQVEIVDEQGTIIFTTDPQDFAGRPSEHASLLRPFLEKRTTGTAIHKIGSSGIIKHIIAVAPLNSIPAAVVLEQAGKVALASPTALRNRLLFSGGIVLFIFTCATILLAWITTKRVVKPILLLTAASQKIAAGELDQPITSIGEDEVALLAHNFEDMRAKLKASRQEIEAWNRELEQRVQNRTKELSALFQASQTLASSLELDTVLASILDIAKNILPQANAGILYINDEDRQSLAIKSSFGFNPNISYLMIPHNGNDCASEAFQSGEASLCRPVRLAQELYGKLSAENSSHISDVKEGPFEVQEGICVPVISEKRIIGVITLYNLRNNNSFSQSDVQLLQSLANQAAIAIANARLFKEASMVGTLRELDRMKTEFVARASHELRTPTTSIKGFAETLLREDLTLPPSEQREFLEGINSAADRLARIITDLLTVSKIESGKLAVKKVPTTLPPIIQKVAEEFRTQARNRTILTDIPANLPAAWADPDRLEDVLDNLISNAIKYSPLDKPVTLHAEIKTREAINNPGSVKSGSDSNPYIVFSVIDEGIGIAPENFVKLFQRFGRIEGALGKGIGGVGLGLYICKVYVEAMEGTIWVNSSPGKGSTFSFSLLAAVKDAKDNTTPGLPEVLESNILESNRNKRSNIKTAHTERILVVDDDADVLKTIQINLRAHGFEVLTASSGEECLDMVANYAPDAIILDVIMPGINGFEVASQLMANPVTKNIPVIFLTARAQEADEIEAQKAGGAGYIKKPFSTQHLYNTVTSVLKSHRGIKNKLT